MTCVKAIHSKYYNLRKLLPINSISSFVEFYNYSTILKRFKVWMSVKYFVKATHLPKCSNFFLSQN